MTVKTPFLSSLLIFLCRESVNGTSYTRTNMSIGGGYLTDIPIELADMPVELTDMPIELADMSIELAGVFAEVR